MKQHTEDKDTTIIYSDCSAKASGDYSAAAEAAYALQNYYVKHGDHVQCVLSSSEEGVQIFNNLYGSKDGLLHIHDKTFEVMPLKKLANDHKKETVKSFVEVAYCCPPSMDEVAKIVDPLSTKVLYVGLPCYDNNDQEVVQNDFPQSYANGLAHAVHTGLGKDRIGVPLYLNTTETINHADYFHITEKPYGFAYSKGGPEGSSNFLKDYLSIATQLAEPYKNFIFVGDCAINLEAVKRFVIRSKQTVEVYDQYNHTENKIEPNADGTGVKVTSLKHLFLHSKSDPNAIHVGLFNKVPHEQMLALEKAALPFTCNEGANSALELISFGKILFFQFAENNAPFIDDYKKSLREIFPAKMREELDNYLKLIFRQSSMSEREREALMSLLNDKKFCKALIDANTKMIRKLPDPAEKMAAELNKPAHINPNYSGPAFGAHDSFLSLLLSALGGNQQKTSADNSPQLKNEINNNASNNIFSLFNNNSPNGPKVIVMDADDFLNGNFEKNSFFKRKSSSSEIKDLRPTKRARVNPGC